MRVPVANYHDDDDRMMRYLHVNGIAWIVFPIGPGRVRHFRADGTEVTLENAYPYDAELTPYTDVGGHA